MNTGHRSLEAIAFGAPERRLSGTLHRPAGAQAARPAVVICNAFGQEGIRAHRMLRVLAERLARQGHAVLRLDFFGTGDSMGDDAQADLAGWQADVLTADAELRQRTGASRTIWMGLRLGATVALLAAYKAPEHLAGVVAWDPILDGRRYLAFLRERHVLSLEEAYSLLPRPSPRAMAADPACFVDEAIGFALPARLREQIEVITPDAWRWPEQAASVHVVCDCATADGQDVVGSAARAGRAPQWIDVRHGTDWTTDTADNSALVPTAVLLKLTALAGAIA